MDGDQLRLSAYPSVYDVAVTAIRTCTPVGHLLTTEHTIPYDPVYRGESEWVLRPAFDHPTEPARLLISGTGLTHRKSAENRQAMHAETAVVTDSMRMYQWGVEGGRPSAGAIGTAPEWFYKGTGAVLRAHNEPLTVPPYAEDGGEEPELAGVYLIDSEGQPYRIGVAQGNEFSDHKTERRNYLYLAPSKLRLCSLGPELVIDPALGDVQGRVSVERNGEVLWSKPIASGESNMCHSLANIEHHHFKFDEHRQPLTAHIHFFGADAFSFGDNVQLQDGDVMEVAFQDFGRPLRNPVHVAQPAPAILRVTPLR